MICPNCKHTFDPHPSKVRDARLAKGWTQLDLSAKSGVSRRTLQSVEAGNKSSKFTRWALEEALKDDALFPKGT